MTIPNAPMPRLAHGFRLQWEPAQDCHVLLYPEGMVKLNRSAGEILLRCDGRTTVAQIVEKLETAFGAKDLHTDVEKFLDLAAAQHWVKLV